MENYYNYNDTPIVKIDVNESNNFYIKRDDMIPFSFGGNKVRIAFEYIEDFKKQNCNCMIAYGNSRSNLCRVMANLCKSNGIECYIISPMEDDEEYIETNNSVMVNNMVKEIIPCRKKDVPEVIKNTLEKIKKEGKKPYYIYDSENEKCTRNAYIKAYKEIKRYEKENNIFFDYIFLATGTSMTQTGLICGQILAKDINRNIIGISNARNRERGMKILEDNLKSYLKDNNVEDTIENYNYDFKDEYVVGGYGKYNNEIIETVKEQLYKNGIPLDVTYTGKAFWGMKKYLEEKEIKNKNILFIHTGGTPLFFDNIKLLKEGTI